MKNVNAETFSDYLQEYLRAVDHFQKDLAKELGLHPKVLNRKLRRYGNAHLTGQEVRSIITTLAQWQAITTQDEALHLLELAQEEPASFSAREWQTPPLSQLMAKDAMMPLSGHTHYSSLHSLQHNLPAPLTRLIGREAAVEQLKHLLRQDDVRLVTLVGTGGSGKTRLALHVANELAGAFAQGVWLVALAAVHNAALLPQSIMQALNIRPVPARSALQSLAAYLQDKQLLLLLDNFEQIEEAAAVVGELLAAVPGLKVLITSRVVLRLYGECEFNVPPLDLPDSNALGDTTEIARFSAVQLFVERARATVPNFTLTTENAAAIAQICARVDGLPLALELAAVRVKVLPPALLLARLEASRLSVLTGGARNLPGRHQLLRNTITWSYDLLCTDAQAWFARLGVFRGGWSLEAAETMLQAVEAHQPSKEASSSKSMMDVLELLVDNSLLERLPPTAGQVRFTLLETLREYALERLNSFGELKCMQDWHACYYLEMAESAEIGLRGPQQLVWQARLVEDQDNFRAALEWSLQRARAGAAMSAPASIGLVFGPDSEARRNEKVPPETLLPVELLAVEVSLRLAAALRPYWEWQGHLVEGRGWMEAALSIPLEQEAGKTLLTARAKALSEAARLLCLQNEQSRAVELAEASITLWRQLDDPRGLATALFYRGWPAHTLGDNALAKDLYEQGLQLLSSRDDVWLRAQLLFYLGAAAGLTHDFEQMRSFYAQSRALFEQVGDKSAIADVLKDQGTMAILEGNYTEAIANLLKSLKLSHALGYKQFIATGMGSLGFAVGMQGKPDPATASLQAAQLWGATAGLFDAVGSSPWSGNLSVVQEMIAQIRSRVDKESWRAAWRAGRALTEEQAIAAYLDSQGSVSTASHLTASRPEIVLP